MQLNQIQISCVRNLESESLNANPAINLLVGENGAGKSSFLEAIHILSTGRSFRSADISKIIKLERGELRVFARGISAFTGEACRVGISRSRGGENKIRINGESVHRLSELAAHYPLQLITPDSIELVTGGAKLRRQYLDWGVFHVEPSQLTLWRQCDRLLKQRNRMLRQGTDARQLAAWDRTLAPAGQALTQARDGYAKALVTVLDEVTGQFFDQDSLSFQFIRGWDSELPLAQALEQSMARDLKSGYSHTGPHRASFRLKLKGKPVEQICSRGQLKVLMCCLKLAQGIHLFEVTGKRCIFLIDDLASELDRRHRELLMALLQQHQFQSFITTIEQQPWLKCLPDPAQEVALFHVEHGKIRQFTA